MNGTLSSYGWILMVIHFLQTRPIPLVPNLQKLAPDWQGQGANRMGQGTGSGVGGVGGGGVGVGGLEEKLATSSRFRSQSITTGTSCTSGRHYGQGFHARFICHNTRHMPCDTYFYTPTHYPMQHAFPDQPIFLQNYAENNKENVAELMMEFFRYYAWNFDYKKSCISVREGRAVPKLLKAETDAWPVNDRLAIEDPFESGYDVAHVMKATQMSYLKKELLRAFTLCSRLVGSGNGSGRGSGNGSRSGGSNDCGP